MYETSIDKKGFGEAYEALWWQKTEYNGTSYHTGGGEYGPMHWFSCGSSVEEVMLAINTCEGGPCVWYKIEVRTQNGMQKIMESGTQPNHVWRR